MRANFCRLQWFGGAFSDFRPFCDPPFTVTVSIMLLKFPNYNLWDYTWHLNPATRWTEQSTAITSVGFTTHLVEVPVLCEHEI